MLGCGRGDEEAEVTGKVVRTEKVCRFRGWSGRLQREAGCKGRVEK